MTLAEHIEKLNEINEELRRNGLNIDDWTYFTTQPGIAVTSFRVGAAVDLIGEGESDKASIIKRLIDSLNCTIIELEKIK